MIALPTDVAKAIVHAYHQFVYVQKRQQREMEEREREKGKGKKKKMTKEEQMKEKRIAEKLMAKADRSLWAEDHAKVLVDFEDTLDKAIRDFIEHHNGAHSIPHSFRSNHLLPDGGDRVFMKLSSRSPKDSSMESRYMRKIFKEELSTMMEAGIVKKGTSNPSFSF